MNEIQSCKINKLGLSHNMLFSLLLIMLSLFMFTGCMNVRGTQSLGIAPKSKAAFAGKKIAILPIRVQTSIATDSLLSLRMALNRKLGVKLKEKFPDSRIIDISRSTEILNDKNKIRLLDDLMVTYDNTGVFNKKITRALGKYLKSNYIVFSRLKAEKMALAILGKGFAASLELMIINTSTNKIVAGGVGEFKRLGIFGMGGTNNNKAAAELIRLAMRRI